MKSESPLNITAEEFRKAGHSLVDQTASFIEALPLKKVTTALRPHEVQLLLQNKSLTIAGEDGQTILTESAQLLF